MPTISRFFGVTIRMYVRDRGPAHFHAIYGDDEAIVSVTTLEVVEGVLPRRAMAMVLEWAAPHRAELVDNWQRAVRHEPLLPMAPLD